MRVTLTRAAFEAALAVAKAAVGSGDYTSRVLLEAALDGGLRLTGSDDHYRAMALADAEVLEAGACLLPHRRAEELLGAAPKGATLEIRTTPSGRIILEAGSAKVEISTLPPEPYPGQTVFYERPPLVEVRLLVSVFREMVLAVAHAADSDDAEPKRSAVELRRKDDWLSAFAVSYEAGAVRRIKQEGSDFVVCVPASRLKRVAQALAREDGEVKMTVDEGLTGLLVDGATGSWLLRAVDAKLPDYGILVNRQSPQRVVVGADPFARAMRLATSATVEIENAHGRKAGRIARAILDIGPDAIGMVAGEDGGDHQAAMRIDAQIQKGEPLVIAANAVALRDAVEALGSETVALDLDGPMKAILIRDALDRDGYCVQMVAPINLANRRV